MKIYNYTIQNIRHLPGSILILTLSPQNKKEAIKFVAGQFVAIKDKKITQTKDKHFFSIASSPNAQGICEFVIKVYGKWTANLSRKKRGESLFLEGPFGSFTFKNQSGNSVFLAGGVGIAPFMSMLRGFKGKKHLKNFYLLYGNRTEQTITYRQELNNLLGNKEKSKVIHILSHLEKDSNWQGYRGFITEEIIKKEVTDFANTHFYICGPPLFVTSINRILKLFKIPPHYISQELFN